ncbi:MAG: aminotransferase class I/II-fold pyridoxal phosphate-dependent enzyme [Planctomycetota bacterium]
MKIKPFATEQYFSLYEFTAEYPLSVSDCETVSVAGLLELAGIPLEEFAETRLSYTESPGIPALRDAVAGTYDGITPDNVIYLGAPVEGIYLAMRGLLEQGDEVVVMRPAYDALINVVEHVCGSYVPWDLKPASDGWDLDFDYLESVVSSSTKMVIVNFPHNPTGFLPSIDEFDRLIAICRANDVVLFCDEMYRGLELAPAKQVPTASVVYEKAITLSGLSKTYGLPGLRSGWLLVRDKETCDELVNWKHYTTICSSATSQQLALIAMSVKERLQQANLELLARNLELADEFFFQHAELFSFRMPSAGSIALVGVRPKLIGDSTVSEYCHHLAAEHGVLLLPGDCLGAQCLDGIEDNVSGYVRFGFGRESFQRSLAAYHDVLADAGLSS